MQNVQSSRQSEDRVPLAAHRLVRSIQRDFQMLGDMLAILCAHDQDLTGEQFSGAARARAAIARGIELTERLSGELE